MCLRQIRRCCNQLPANDSPLCPSHLRQLARASKYRACKYDPTELLAAAGTLSTPEEIHKMLTKTTLLLIADKIPLKKAGILSYLAQNLLRAHRESREHQQFLEEKAERERPCTYTWNVPRPERD